MAINNKSNNTTKTLALTNDISNPNLLINPDFKINQRGQSTYKFSPGSDYSVDRWKVWNGSLTVNSDKTITLKNIVSGENCTIVQPLENIVDTSCVISAYVVDFSGECSIRSEDSTDEYQSGITVTKKGLITVNCKGCKMVSIAVIGNGFITLKYVKLEKGTVATPFIEPNPATELLKCKYFYSKLAIYTGYNIALGILGSYLYLPLNQKMRANPTISLNKSTITVAIPESNINKKYNIQSIELAYLYDNCIYIYIKTNPGYSTWTGRIVEDVIHISLNAEIY